MDDRIRRQHFFQRGAEGGDEFRRQVGDESHRVGQDRLGPLGQFQPAHRRVEGREQQVLGQHLGRGQRVEQRRLPGIGVADQRDHRERHALARLSLKPAVCA